MIYLEGRKELKLIFDVPVSVNNYLKPKGLIKYAYNKPIVILNMFETVEARAYKKRFKRYVLAQMKLQGWEMDANKNTFYVIESVVYFKKRGMDSNNCWKISLDALTECQVWTDDSMVIERCTRVYYDDVNPRIEYTIYIAEHIGIFDTEGDYIDYLYRCNTCSRYKNGVCSVHKKALESRIQESVIKENDKWICQKYKEIVIKTPKKSKKKGVA